MRRPRDLPASPDPSLPASPSEPPFTSAIPYVLRLLQFLIGPVCPVLTAESPKQRACLSPRDAQCLHLVGEGKQKRGLGLLHTPQPPMQAPGRSGQTYGAGGARAETKVPCLEDHT